MTDFSNDSAIGLAHGHVRLAEPSPRWAIFFDQEAALLVPALPHGAKVEHCGSTSVPSLPAKPILDVLIGVPVPLNVPQLRRALEPLGYDYTPQAGVPGHEIFGKGQPRTHLLHIVPLKGVAWDRMIQFRDALRAEVALASEYADLKRQLAARFSTDRAAYTEAKGEFVDRVLRRQPPGRG